MRKFHFYIHALLLVTSPSLLSFPQCEYALEQHSQEFNSFNPSYDEILTLLENIDEGRIEGYSDESVEEIRHFVTLLAQQGTLSRDYAVNIDLQNDILDLYAEQDMFSDYCFDNGVEDFTILSTVFVQEQADGMIFLCKHKHKHKGKCHHHSSHDHDKRKKNLFAKIRRFVKKHRKAIIIGAACIVAATIVIVALAAAPSTVAAATGAAVGAAAASENDNTSSSNTPDVPPAMAATFEAPLLKSVIDGQILSFKENMAQNQFFEKVKGQQNLTWEENGRALGSIFAHDTYTNLQNELPYHPKLSQEIHDFHTKYGYTIPGASQGASKGHDEIDKQFMTNYGYLYSNSTQDIDFNILSHQVRGEKALSVGYYEQAIQDFGRAIEFNPTNPIPYLKRGIAHFGSGQYEHSIEDYKEYVSQTQQPIPLTVSEFTFGFAKGVPQGVYDSGEGLLLFMADCVKHPIETSRQIVNSITALVDLVRKDEWGVVAETLAPEIYQLVTEWDILSSEKRGELAGYAVGKHGTDILAPGALTKVASKSVKSAQELAAICKNLEIAQETLILETAAGIGNSVKIAEIVEGGQKLSFLGEELGFTPQEMGQLKKLGKLEQAIDGACESWLAKSPSEAYVAAKNGGKHARIITEFSDKSVKEIQKSIRSYEKLIAEHKDKIVNPSKYCPDWDTMDPRRRDALVNKRWPAEIQCYTEQSEILQTILNQRQ